MSRDLPTGLGAAFSAKTVALAYLVEIDWPDRLSYLWNGYHDLVWDGKTFQGVGQLGGLGEMRESKDTSANGLALTLSGVKPENTADALRRDIQARTVIVWVGVIVGGSFAIDPVRMFTGQADSAGITDDGNSASITLQCEKELIDNRSNFYRYTDADQQILFPGDRGFEFVAVLSSIKITWGKFAITNYRPSTSIGTQLASI